MLRGQAFTYEMQCTSPANAVLGPATHMSAHAEGAAPPCQGSRPDQDNADRRFRPCNAVGLPRSSLWRSPGARQNYHVRLKTLGNSNTIPLLTEFKTCGYKYINSFDTKQDQASEWAPEKSRSHHPSVGYEMGSLVAVQSSP